MCLSFLLGSSKVFRLTHTDNVCVPYGFLLTGPELVLHLFFAFLGSALVVRLNSNALPILSHVSLPATHNFWLWLKITFFFEHFI